MTQSKSIWRNIINLALPGGAAFWLANFCISLTPIAAEYRAGLSISYYPMLLEALIGGLVLGFCISYFLVRFYEKLPTKNPMEKSLLLSTLVLILVTLLVEVPAKFGTPAGGGMHFFIIGLVINIIRLLSLGIAIGYFYNKVEKRTSG